MMFQLDGIGFLGRIRGKYVYEMDCDGTPTRYICHGPWNGSIRIQLVHGELTYKDGQGRTMLVFESDEDEFSSWGQSC